MRVCIIASRNMSIGNLRSVGMYVSRMVNVGLTPFYPSELFLKVRGMSINYLYSGLDSSGGVEVQVTPLVLVGLHFLPPR